MNPILRDRVVNNLEPALGKKLIEVKYWCLDGEMTLEDLYDPQFYCGGEIELMFNPEFTTLITWDENAGWNDHFSIQTRTQTAFIPDRLRCWKASRLPTWNDHMGKMLDQIRVLGMEGTPFLIEFEFSTGKTYIGIGHKKEFRDGDDVLVLSENRMPHSQTLQVLWSSGSKLSKE